MVSVVERFLKQRCKRVEPRRQICGAALELAPNFSSSSFSVNSNLQSIYTFSAPQGSTLFPEVLLKVAFCYLPF